MTARKPVAIAVAVVLALAAITLGLRSGGERRVSAVFPRTVSLFEGSDVRIMGIRVGEVQTITPSGTSVRVDMTVDEEYRLPADVRAVIVSPSIVADRFVQLTPAYDGGTVLAEGAVIGQDRTATPVELDETFSSTDRLLRALGPEGANRDGAVSDVLGVLADTLDGQGAKLHDTIGGLADVSSTLAASSDDITGTVEHLAGLTGELARYDGDVAELNTRLASVADVLADDREDISELLRSLATSLGTIEEFVADHRESLTRNVESLVGVTDALQSEREALRQIVELAPLGFSNLNAVYDAPTQSVRTRANFAEILKTVDNVICNELTKQVGDQAAAACGLLKDVVDGLGVRDLLSVPSLGGSPSAAAPQTGDLTDLLTRTLTVLPGGGR